MKDPTSNAVAQAEWASQAKNELFLSVETFRHTAAFAKEALALRRYNEGDLCTSFAATQDWISEEPFSNRAYRAAASIANSMDDYGRAIELARKGLKHDPQSPYLLNSLAFALASADHLDHAANTLRSLTFTKKDRNIELVAQANGALISMRRGHLEEGERNYRKVISAFKDQQNMKCSAAVYFAREAVRAKHENATEILFQAREILSEAKLGRPSAYRTEERILSSVERNLKHEEVTEQRQRTEVCSRAVG